MFRRNKQQPGGLPLSSTSYSSNGSGKSIQMDAPLVQMIKAFSVGTKISYGFLFFCLFMIFGGWRHIIRSRAHVLLHCSPTVCSLEIVEPRNPKMNVLFHRQQIVRSDYVKIDSKSGEIIELLQGRTKPVHPKKKGKNTSANFESYTLVLRNYNQTEMGSLQDDIESLSTYTSTKSLVPFHQLSATTLRDIGFSFNSTTNENICILRRFYIANRVWVQHSRFKNYIQGKRNKITLREYKAPPILGILLIVFGIFALIFTMILGQFWEESYSSRDRTIARRKRYESEKQRRTAAFKVKD